MPNSNRAEGSPKFFKHNRNINVEVGIYFTLKKDSMVYKIVGEAYHLGSNIFVVEEVNGHLGMYKNVDSIRLHGMPLDPKVAKVLYETS